MRPDRGPWRWLLPAVFWLAVWWLLALIVGKELLIPSPPLVVRTLLELVVTGAFWRYTALTLLRITLGLLLGIVLGILTALLTNRLSLLHALLAPAVRVVRATPVASFIILVLLWVANGRVPTVISALVGVEVRRGGGGAVPPEGRRRHAGLFLQALSRHARALCVDAHCRGAVAHGGAHRAAAAAREKGGRQMKLTDLTFSYGDKRVFQALTLALPDEGITALTGPSGCGKTTLLRLIARLETPQGGSIDAPPAEQIALLFQEDRLIPRLSARRQIELVRPKGKDADAWLAAVGLAGEADAAPEALSGGMRRRLSLARCLAYGQDKRLLLLDEPFTGVDADRIRALADLIRSMKIPTIFTAHDSESLGMAETIISL